MTRLQISAIIALIAISWGCSLALAGIPVTLEYLAPFSATVGVVSVALTVFNLYLWRLPLIRSVLADRPVLAGGWRLKITSSFIDEATGKNTEIDGYYVIRQTYLAVSVRAYTKRTTSKTLATKLIKDADGEWSLVFTYEDWRPLMDASSSHRGTVILVLAGNPVTGFHGHYWTERKSGGNVASVARLRANPDFASYDQAVAAFEKEARES